jgi:hypothetical protein
MLVKALVVLALVLLPPLALRLAGKPLSGRFLGIPYDFTPPTVARVKRTACNPDNDRLLAPHTYGWGYSINFHAVARRLRLIRD